MKFGVCVGDNIANMKIAKEIGYDYVETNCGNIVRADEKLIEEIKKVGIPVLSANCFIGLRVVGPERDENKIEEYVSKLFERASYLGIKVLVFGSSGARKMREEEGLSHDECIDQIAYFLKKFVAPLAEKYNIRVAIEPLRPAECNIINTIAQGVEVSKKVGSSYVKVLADVKHMCDQGEPLSEIDKYAEYLIHAHTSDAYGDENHGRMFPKQSNKFNQADFIEPLKKAGVELCSIEADVIDFEKDAKEAYNILKNFR